MRGGFLSQLTGGERQKVMLARALVDVYRVSAQPLEVLGQTIVMVD